MFRYRELQVASKLTERITYYDACEWETVYIAHHLNFIAIAKIILRHEMERGQSMRR